MPFDPMQGFTAMQQGAAMGQAGGNFAGVGQMIRNILEKAGKLGLVQAQSQYQTQGAANLEAYKQQVQQDQLDRFQTDNPDLYQDGRPRLYTDPATGQTYVANVDITGGIPTRKWSFDRPMNQVEADRLDAQERAAKKGGKSSAFKLTPQPQ